MHKVSLDASGQVFLREDVPRSRRPQNSHKLWLEKTETGLVLHPLRPDVRKVYMKLTTRCNLDCRT